MKKLVLFILFSISTLYAVDERYVDFYYGNGVWNTKKDAWDSADALKDIIASEVKAEYVGKIDLAYNWTHGKFDDIIETLYQLQQEGQLELGALSSLRKPAMLYPDVMAAIAAVTVDSMRQASQTRAEDIAEMVKSYNASINSGHKVVLVSHSQGNLFGIQAYDELESWQRKYFKQVSVATPAKRVAGGGEWVTVRDDLIIQWILDVVADDILPYNADNFNTDFIGTHHGFVEEYLNGYATRGKIISMVKSAYEKSLKAPSQWLFVGKETCTMSGCDNKTREVNHRYDSSLDSLMEKQKVYPFDDDGLLYSAGGYVKNQSPKGAAVEKSEQESECFLLKDGNNATINVVEKGEVCRTCDGHELTEDDVEVTLAWANPNIDMQLSVSFPDGGNDVIDPICRIQHFHAPDTDQPGTYPVSVKYNEIYNENYNMSILDRIRKDIYVSIKVPRPAKVESRSTNMKEIDYLDGHVADIRVYEPNGTSSGSGNGGYTWHTTDKPSLKRFFERLTTDTGFNYGSGWTLSEKGILVQGNMTKLYYYEILWHISKALLGPLSGADIKTYEFNDYMQNGDRASVVYQGKTTEGSLIETAGTIPVVSHLKDDVMYVLEIKNGMDIDADDDGNEDMQPTQNNGVIRLVLGGYELKTMGFKANILTEITHSLAKDSYNGNISSYIEKSNDVAACLLRYDINFDGNMNMLDTASWAPFYGKDELLRHNYSQFYQPALDKIHNGMDINEEAFKIYKNPIFLDEKMYFLNNASIGDNIGKATFVCGGGFTEYAVVGGSSVYFDIDNKGNIIIKQLPRNKGTYNVQVKMSNMQNEEVFGNVTIQMIDKDAPTLMKGNFVNEIPDTIEDGYNLGPAVIIDDGRGNLTDIWLEGDGAENFEIDFNGFLRVSKYSNIDRNDGAYNLQVIASNEYGSSIPLGIFILVFEEYELSPVLRNTFVGFQETESQINQVIGRMTYRESPFCPVMEFVAKPNSVFGIQQNGNIYIKSVPSEDNYTIKVNAVGSCGMSKSANLFIDKTTRLIGSEMEMSAAKGLATSADGSTAFVADGKSGLKIVNVSNPAFPENIGSIKTSYAYDIALSADEKRAFLADGEEGLKIIDVSDITNPNLIGSVKTFYAQGVTIDGFRAFISDGAEGFKIVDISNTANPSIISSYNKYSVYDTAVSSDNQSLLFVASGFGGIIAFDVTDISNPVLIGSLETAYAGKVTLSADNKKLFAADGIGGLKIIDVSNPTKLSILGSVKSVYAQDIVLSKDNSKIFMADREGGLKIVQTADARNPAIVGIVSVSDVYALSILQNNNVLTADKNGVLRIVSIEDIATTPVVIPSAFSVVENSQLGTVVGNVIVGVDTKYPVTSIELSGNGADKFKINANGVVTVSEKAGLDYETKSSYDLYAVAFNAFGSSNNANITIKIIDTPDILPIVQVGMFDVDENSPSGTLVGKLVIDKGDSQITSVKLHGSGAERFVVQNDGSIVVSNNANLDYEHKNYYELSAVVTNEYGSAAAAVYININDLSDSPPTFYSYMSRGQIQENSLYGEQVASLYITSLEPLTDIYLEGIGSENFDINTDGIITVSDTATLDYEANNFYSLKVTAVNKYGVGSDMVDIEIVNTPDSPPVILGTIITIDKHAQSRDYPIGYLNIYTDGSIVDSVNLFGDASLNLIADNDGAISVASWANLDYYSEGIHEFYATATNRFGSSDNATIILNVKSSLESIPVLSNITYVTFGSDIKEGSYIGGIPVATDIHCQINNWVFGENSSIVSDEYGSSVIATDNITSGAIYKTTVYANSVCGDSNIATIIIDTKNRTAQYGILGENRLYSGVLSFLDNETLLAYGEENNLFYAVNLYDDSKNRPMDFMMNEEGQVMPLMISSEDGKYIYTVVRNNTDYSFDFRIYDMSAQTPLLTGAEKMSNNMDMYDSNIVLSKDGKKIFLGTRSNVVIIDVSEPNAPKIASKILTNSYSKTAFFLDEQTIYLNYPSNMGQNNIVVKYDISDIYNPVKIDVAMMPSSTKIIHINNEALFGIVNYTYLAAYDTSDISNLELMGVSFGFDNQMFYNNSIVNIFGNKVFVAGVSGFALADFGVRENPKIEALMPYNINLFRSANKIISNQDNSMLFYTDQDHIIGINVKDIGR